jgi:membrane protease YdiL (CAAX protease family)
MPPLHPDTKRIAVVLVAALAVCVWMAGVSFRVGALYALLLIVAGVSYYYIRRISNMTAGILLITLTVTLWWAINQDFTTGAIASGVAVVLMVAAHEGGFTRDGVTRTLYGIDENWETDLPTAGVIGLLYIALITMVPSISMTVPSPDMLSGWTDHTFFATSTEYLIVVCVLAPISEEGVFRGILFPAFSSMLGDDMRGMIGGGLVAAAIISSIAFSLFHWTAYGAEFMEGAFVGAFIFGLLMCAVAYWQKSIIGCILIHAMTNAWIVQEMFAVVQ